MYIEPTDEFEMRNIINKMNKNKNKSADIDGIMPIDLQNNADNLALIIVKLINLSLHEGKIPKMLKTLIIRPIQKSGKRSDIYRVLKK